MIIKLYKQMTKIKVHAEKNCRKILRPESDFSPTIQMWYDRIHAYLQLIRLREGKAKNDGNILRFARRQHIPTPDLLTMEELKDGLQLARIRKADLRKQAKGLRKVHLRDCLIDAQTKRQHKRVTAIRQRCNREESKRMWYLIKRTVKDPSNPSVLRVQRVVNGEVKEYVVQEDVEQAIQIGFSLGRELNPEPHLRSCFTRAATLASSFVRTASDGTEIPVRSYAANDASQRAAKSVCTRRYSTARRTDASTNSVSVSPAFSEGMMMEACDRVATSGA